MSDEMSTQEQVRAEYARSLKWLNTIIEASEEHQHDDPSCGAQPLCIGPANLIAMASIMRSTPGAEMPLVMVAVHEISKLRKRVADMEQLLRIAGDSCISEESRRYLRKLRDQD